MYQLLRIDPNSVSSFPGARLVFSLYQDDQKMNLSTLAEADIKVYFTNGDVRQGLIHETDDTFSVVVPPLSGSHRVGVAVSWFDNSDRAEFDLKITPVQGGFFTLTTNPSLTPVPPVYADVFSPVGDVLETLEMDFDGENYSIESRAGNDWVTGEYRAAIRDETGYIDIYPFWVERPKLASMPLYFSLPEWQQQVIEFIKYQMMGDSEPLHPGAWFTLEEYAKFWKGVTQEINAINPQTRLHVNAVPPQLGDVMMQGTLLRIYHALANRAAPAPKWTGTNTPMLDESQLQQNWERRHSSLYPQYEEQRAYAKAMFLPDAKISIDPWPSWMRGAVGGSTQAALLGHPTWYKTYRGA